MAPRILLQRRNDTGEVGSADGNWRASAAPEDFILEGWSEGFMVGALVIMACITIANMRRGVLLHKLILVEVSSYVRCRTEVRMWRLTHENHAATCSAYTW